ncbi:hypothetical protein K1T71_002115, partial [Dendrolimus kikuchii]
MGHAYLDSLCSHETRRYPDCTLQETQALIVRSTTLPYVEGTWTNPREQLVQNKINTGNYYNNGPHLHRDLFIDNDEGSGVDNDESSGSGWGAGPGPDDEDARGGGSGDGPDIPEDDEDYEPTVNHQTTQKPGTERKFDSDYIDFSETPESPQTPETPVVPETPVT